MLEGIPLSLFHEWAEYNAVSPFTAMRDDWRMGMIVAQINNILGGRAKATDYLLPDTVRKPQKSDAEMEMIFDRIFTNMQRRQETNG